MSTLSPVRLSHLRCEYKINPLGIDEQQPRLSWELNADERDVRQTAYQIRVASDPDRLADEAALIWDSGIVSTAESIHQVYAGPALQSRQRYYWQVRIWDQHNRPSAWSEPAWWEMGLLHRDDWQATWIQPAMAEDTSQSQPCPMLRTTFTVDGPVQSARLYITSLGLYEAAINGRRVGDQLFTPGWTSYDHRLQYQTYDVTAHLQAGENAIGVTLGDGWYRGYLGFEGQRNVYGEKLALLSQLHIRYADGREQLVLSDENWRAATGPILMSDIYNGETYDARLECPGWSEAGYDAHDWVGVQPIDHPYDILVAPVGPPVRRIEEIRPVKILHTPAGETVFDMGQNMVGWIRLQVEGEAGTTVTLRHGEVLDQAGNLYTENLRSAAQTVRYTLKGGGPEIFEPHFTFQGFRFVAVDGYPGEPTLDSLTGVVIHSAVTPTGHFSCSNPKINRLQHNIVWGQKGNFLDVPTDCPQRDERLGWTGDAQVFIRTACFNMDVAGFFTKWLRDLAADQRENGSIGFVIPDVLGKISGFGRQGSAAWGDAGTICPWTLYLCYGDKRILETQYPSMVGWVEFIRAQAGEDCLWNTGFHFGDWLSYNSTELMAEPAFTAKDLIATAFFAYSTQLVQQTAQVLGKTEDAQKYAALLERIKQAFCQEFVTPNGRLSSDTQTAYALALMFDLLPEEQRPSAARRLVADIRRRGYHLSTGFVGTPYLCHVLTRFGYLDVAYALLNQETYPSWLYPLQWDATTIWERWDGIKPNGEFQDPRMNSFNHYAYGAIGDWMYRVVAGLDTDPTAPGYKHLLIHPHPGGGLTQAEATLQTPYGLAGSAWQITDEGFQLTVTVPANTRATVRLPGAAQEDVREGGQPLSAVAGVHQTWVEGDDLIVELGSGRYEFAYPTQRFRPAAGEFGIHSPLSKLLENPAAKAVLQTHLPELMNSPFIRRASDITLEQIASFIPDQLTPQVLDKIAADLAQIS